MIRLGYDTYSIRAFRWKAKQLIDYAASQKLDTLQISSVGEYDNAGAEHLGAMRSYASERGITIDAGTGCICPTSSSYSPKEKDPVEYTVQGLRVANAVGSRAMRCFLGSRPDRMDIERHMESTIKVLRAVRQQALDLNVKIAIENHNGDLTASEVRTIIETAGKEFVGSCLDLGNPFWLVEHPEVTLETLAPYVVTTHVRDTAVYEHPRGCAFQWVALGDGSVDWVSLMKKYRQLVPEVPMQLEIITGRPPVVLPYLEPDFWKAFPKSDAASFARFVALVKSGRPFEKFMVVEDGARPVVPEFAAALKEQQRIDLERSLEVAKKQLDVGVRWRS